MKSFLAGDAFADRTVVLIGGGSGIGFAVAKLVVSGGGAVVLGGRRAGALEKAAAELGPSATWQVVDTADERAVEAVFARLDSVDAVFTTAATYITGSLRELSISDAASPFDSKFWGQYRVVKAALPVLAADASVVLMAGAASVRPAGAAPAYVAANAAIEGLARGLAVELAPVRVNAISPGTVDGNLWNQRPQAVRQAAFDHFVEASTSGKLVREDEIAAAVIHLFLNGATTGSTLYPDGGYSLR
ncbi:SDR family oxidoreductase [Mycolicibacterium llatzerense]|uniref:SDR family oxidoreductase n=1 Tax=Mycolicibacterium llatzerense TaxID=280871 RepID=UPI0021B5C098|nr:SDR family oxidoreductase [Mycolicibacterium llatzerense]MCT7366203.1 short-chain dehydrogenase [Mycolicibacterium llatzerense]MCT7370080.1 short-chain dehydrogenase [Mycolicibacterium llatzerense]